MNLKDAFRLWKEESSSKGIKCVHGGLEGGPGFLDFGSCKLDKHSNVEYGHDYCPENCPDYCITDDRQLFQTFLTLYRHSASFYNEKYKINPKDPYYTKGYVPKESSDSDKIIELLNFKPV